MTSDQLIQAVLEKRLGEELRTLSTFSSKSPLFHRQGGDVNRHIQILSANLALFPAGQTIIDHYANLTPERVVHG
eukprot:Skav222208  [mRNA]  locus=scaffold552:8365:8589:+ [translate_table: standard]